jgi:hypothetical protein
VAWEKTLRLSADSDSRAINPALVVDTVAVSDVSRTRTSKSPVIVL